MCEECTSGEHAEHPTVPLKDVLEQHKASLQDQLDAVKSRLAPGSHMVPWDQRMAEVPERLKILRLYHTVDSRYPPISLFLPPCAFSFLICRLPEIDTALQVLSDILQKLTHQKASIEEDIHAAFDELQKTLNVRKSVLLMELEVNYGLKQKVCGCWSVAWKDKFDMKYNQ